jgi:Cys-tRNA(Pro)/Cys-tRNA(Cys) deacylase
VPPQRVLKTLVVDLAGHGLCVGLIPVSNQLNMKLIAQRGVKRAAMAAAAAVVRSTGYVMGGVSPLGQKRVIAAFIDVLARIFPSIFVSAGKRGLDMEMAAEDLGRLLNAGFCKLC